MGIEWKETRPGHFEREADPTERWFEVITRTGRDRSREHWALSATVKIDIPSTELLQKARRAWISLRHDLPSVASILDRQKSLWKYDVASVTELEFWLTETFVATCQHELSSQLAPPRRPTLYVMPDDQQLTLRCPHTSTDGRGLIGLMNRLISSMETPQEVSFGTEGGNLSPPLRIAAKLGKNSPEHARRAEQVLDEYLSSFPSIGLPTRKSASLSSIAPGTAAKFSKRFSKCQTQAIIRAIKEQKLTPTHAFHSAIALATASLDNTSAKTYTSVLSIDGRRVYGGQINQNFASLYVTGWFPTIRPTDFASTAAAFKDLYMLPQKDKMLQNVVELVIEDMLPLLAVQSSSLQSDPSLSSLGIIEQTLQRTYGDMVVLEFDMNIEILTAGVSVHLYTWRDQLTLNAFFNEAFHERECIERFMKLTTDILFEGLGLEDLGGKGQVE